VTRENVESSSSLADKITVEAQALADLKVEKAAVEGERRTVVLALSKQDRRVALRRGRRRMAGQA
jgi:hypothetical protein